MCCIGWTSRDNELPPSLEIGAPGWAGAHAEEWTDRVPEAHSGMAEQLSTLAALPSIQGILSLYTADFFT